MNGSASRDWPAHPGGAFRAWPWLAAALLAGAVVARWAGAPLHAPARADTTIAGQDLAVLSFQSGNAELCAVLDDHSEMILLYRIGARGSVDLIHRADLPDLFRRARAGRPPRE